MTQPMQRDSSAYNYLETFFFFFSSQDVMSGSLAQLERHLFRKKVTPMTLQWTRIQNTQMLSSKKQMKKCGIFFFFFISLCPELPISVLSACFSDISYTGEQRSRALLHWFFCFVMTQNPASVLPAKWTRHTCSLGLSHTHTHTHTLIHYDR